MSKRGVIAGRPRRLGRYTVVVAAVDHATNTATVVVHLHVVAPFPKLSRAVLSGVARRRPVLAFSVVRGRYAPLLRSIGVRLPRGLTFGRHGRGIHIASGRHRVRFHFARRRDGLVITFRRPQRSVHVVLGSGTLFANRGIARTARRRGARLRVRVSATDRHRRMTRYTVRLRP